MKDKFAIVLYLGLTLKSVARLQQRLETEVALALIEARKRNYDIPGSPCSYLKITGRWRR